MGPSDHKKGVRVRVLYNSSYKFGRGSTGSIRVLDGVLQGKGYS